MADDKEAKKVLLGQARALGMEVDGRWSVDTLAEKVLEAQEALTEANNQAVRDASDTWVYMLRDGFAEEDVKLRAGGSFKVPAMIADRWYECGVARPVTREAALAFEAQEAQKAAALRDGDRAIAKLDKEMLLEQAHAARMGQVRV